MRHVTASELRDNLETHLDAVGDDADKLVITRKDGEGIVLVKLSEWEGLQETLYLMSNPANYKHLLESMAEADAGKLTERELIDP